MKNKIPPPILLLLMGTVMWFIAHSNFSYSVTVPYGLVLGLGLGAFGVLIALLAMRQFRAAQTTVNPLLPESASSLVTSGVFGYSRNPMYVGLLLVSAGWALWLGSLSNIAMMLLFALLITELQIKPEENALKKLFGEDYEAYCRRVRRWV
jgi:protein-S-isoprenylcysteine O-methyltransferase Ste14